MANSTIDVLARIPWLVEYNLPAFVSLERTIHNTDNQLDSFIESLLSEINAWKSASNKSVMSLQSVLQNFYQGTLLGTDVPECSTLYNCGGFFSWITNQPLDYAFTIVNVTDPTGQTPNQITCPVITDWVDVIAGAPESESNSIDGVGEIIHQASTNYVYNTMFRPSVVQSLSASPMPMLLDTKGYRKLAILNTGLIIEV